MRTISIQRVSKALFIRPLRWKHTVHSLPIFTLSTIQANTRRQHNVDTILGHRRRTTLAQHHHTLCLVG